ncbi:MAG: hypothetical protein O8C66_13320 [Candidatus Methanoperedens sp.]|nr:hypothetical protein [Candidatus Methanoperedens sp.]MCZ7371478.1 hypothetical protein [Candidatus Methanoperedens sp.]
MNKKVKIGLLIISVTVICFIIISITNNTYIGPKGEDFPFYSLMFRGLTYDGKGNLSWEKISWNFLEPQKYNYKYSVRTPGKSIEVSSFSYGGDYNVSSDAFQSYENLLEKNRYNKIDFHVTIESGKFVILNSSAFENNYFVYVELIRTLSDTYYVIVIKSNINEKEVVKTLVKGNTT